MLATLVPLSQNPQDTPTVCVGIFCAPMAFNRRRDRERKGGRDPFGHLQDERAQAETGDPWFVGDDDGPELDVQAGVSSNLSEDDLDTDKPDK